MSVSDTLCHHMEKLRDTADLMTANAEQGFFKAYGATLTQVCETWVNYRPVQSEQCNLK